MQLSWNDLLIPIEAVEPANCLAPWGSIIADRVIPVAISAFGDWFLMEKNGTIRHLCMLQGTFEMVARNQADFQLKMNDPNWQETFLLSSLIGTLKQQGITRSEAQCFGFQIHPVFGGVAESSNVVVLDLLVWNSICHQIHFRS